MKKYTIETDIYDILIIDKSYLGSCKKIYNWHNRTGSFLFHAKILKYYNLSSIFENIRDKLEGM